MRAAKAEERAGFRLMDVVTGVSTATVGSCNGRRSGSWWPSHLDWSLHNSRRDGEELWLLAAPPRCRQVSGRSRWLEESGVATAGRCRSLTTGRSRGREPRREAADACGASSFVYLGALMRASLGPRGVVVSSLTLAWSLPNFIHRLLFQMLGLSVALLGAVGREQGGSVHDTRLPVLQPKAKSFLQQALGRWLHGAGCQREREAAERHDCAGGQRARCTQIFIDGTHIVAGAIGLLTEHECGRLQERLDAAGIAYREPVADDCKRQATCLRPVVGGLGSEAWLGDSSSLRAHRVPIIGGWRERRLCCRRRRRWMSNCRCGSAC